jgi:triphosphoribosyl-dephospho-CoA synthase CitG
MMLTAQVTELLRDVLMEEVCATPKPGLVDLRDSGAHRDMDAHTFFRSAEAVAPHLGRIFEVSVRWTGELPALFEVIRLIGVEAEEAMFRATGDVNTHRGAIFTMGLLSAAAGQCRRRTGCFSTDKILDLSRSMAAETLTKELQAIRNRPPRTHGERLYAATGCTGIRGEAIAGFPSLRETAVPALAQGGQPDRNSLLLYVLLRLMTVVEDSTVIHRAGQAGLNWMQAQASSFLAGWPVLTGQALEVLSGFNSDCIARNISPGGCADLLSAALFLEGLETLS